MVLYLQGESVVGCLCGVQVVLPLADFGVFSGYMWFSVVRFLGEQTGGTVASLCSINMVWLHLQKQQLSVTTGLFYSAVEMVPDMDTVLSLCCLKKVIINRGFK